MSSIQLHNFTAVENALDGQEYVFISQNENTRKATLNLIKQFIIGNDELLTSDKTSIINAINEITRNVILNNQGISNVTSTANEINENVQKLSEKIGDIDLTSEKNIKEQLTDLTTSKIDITKIEDSCTENNITDKVLNARQGYLLRKDLETLPLTKTDVQINTTLGSWKQEFTNSVNDTDNTFPIDSFSGMIIQYDMDDYRVQFAIQGKDAGNIYVRSVNAGRTFTGLYDETSTTWSLLNRVTYKCPANKDRTEITLSNAKIYYSINNGWCSVEFKDVEGQGTNIEYMATSELPYPIQSTSTFLEKDGQFVGTIYIEDNGRIYGHKTSADAGFGSLIYKIDENKY